MATVKKWIAASPDDVWAVLADARSYAFWVVGSHDVPKFDATWPAIGSTFHHVQGHGPFKLSDTTTVVECQPGRRLLLEVRIRPFLTGPVELVLEPDGEGTCVSLTERAEGGLGGFFPGFVTGPPIAVRNAAALRRLAGMAWARAAALGQAPDDAGGPRGQRG
ncbi:MAG: SRPBCC family protein [Solirubrobacteraceae bacterium]|nr:SRPBCC family protein [Solirubrobacteraceae bacterium]